MVTIADPWNPSSSEVRAWAYAPDGMQPCQDWDLSLSWGGHERDYLEFAADPACPSQRFFLHVLYLMVGDAVRSGYHSVPEATVRGFIDLAAHHQSPELRLWRERALILLKASVEI